MANFKTIFEAALAELQFVYLDAYPIDGGAIFGTHPFNVEPDRTSPGYLHDVESIRARGGDITNFSTFVFRPHAAIQLHQLSGQLDARLTMGALRELSGAVEDYLREAALLSLCDPAGSA